MSHRDPSGTASTTILGHATTIGQRLPLGIDDPVIAARAVRRALAAGGHRAVDVDLLVVASPPPLSPPSVRRFARRALGPHGAEVQVELVAPDDEVEGARLATLAAAVPAAAGVAADALVVAVGIGRDGTTVALCLTSPGGSEPG